MSSIMKTPILEEYTKRNNIEYKFFLVVEYKIGSLFEIDIKREERIFIYMTDSNDNFLQVEEIDVNDDVLYEEHIIPIAKRFIREQKLKELGI